MNLIIGRKPVLEALNSNKKIQSVYILFNQQGEIIDAIRIAAKKKGIKCNLVSHEKFKSLSSSKNTQGVIAVQSNFHFYSLEELIDATLESDVKIILILDSIQDPHNVGAIIRTAECAGVKSIITTIHNSAPINETVTKTSVGAIEHLKISQAGNLINVINVLKKEGFWIAGTSLKSSKNIFETKFTFPLALVVGNEEKGLRRLTEENCDILVKIPLKGKIQSLNVSVAAGIALFEITKQLSN